MEEYASALIIPSPGSLAAVIDSLSSARYSAHAVRDLIVSKAEHTTTEMASVAVKIAKEHLPLVDRFRNNVDLLLVDSLQTADQSNEQKATKYTKPCTLEYTFHGITADGRQIYSNKAAEQGKMSKNSDATYLLCVPRVCKGADAKILYQRYKQKDTKSSHHHHKKSTEHFLAICGLTLLHCTDKARKHSYLKRIVKGAFKTLLPHTSHQLSAHTVSDNILCIEPYLSLEDHFYEDNDAYTLPWAMQKY